MTAQAAAGARGVLRRYAPRALLLVGLGLVVALTAPAIPEDQTIVFRLGSSDVKRLSATFTRRGETEPVSGATLSFEGHAPREVRHELALPNGEYVLDIELAGTEPPALAQTSLVRRVNLQGGVTTVFVESRLP